MKKPSRIITAEGFFNLKDLVCWDLIKITISNIKKKNF
jgi:hypothetical protein